MVRASQGFSKIDRIHLKIILDTFPISAEILRMTQLMLCI